MMEDILDELYDDIQELRESGENDLRTVLHYVEKAIKKYKQLEENNG